VTHSLRRPCSRRRGNRRKYPFVAVAYRGFEDGVGHEHDSGGRVVRHFGRFLRRVGRTDEATDLAEVSASEAADATEEAAEVADDSAAGVARRSSQPERRSLSRSRAPPWA
jgi:hypothetical protein